MNRKYWITAAALICLLYSCQPTSQAANIQPVAEVAVATPVYGISGPVQSKPGELCVFRAVLPEGCKGAWIVIPPDVGNKHTYVDSQGLAMAFASPKPGMYYVVMSASIDSEVVQFYHELENVTPGPDPDPGPDPIPPPPPPPPPGKRFVLVVREARDVLPTPEESVVIGGLRRYANEKKHTWRMEDKDLKDASEKTPAWLAYYLEEIEKADVAIPALVIGSFTADDEGVENVVITPLPDSPEAAIIELKKHGG